MGPSEMQLKIEPVWVMITAAAASHLLAAQISRKCWMSIMPPTRVAAQSFRCICLSTGISSSCKQS
jgi:hypothetical protein